MEIINDKEMMGVRRVIRFDSLVDLGKYCEASIKKWGQTGSSATHKPSTSWDRNVGMMGAIDMAKHGGWDEGGKMIAQGMANFQATMTKAPSRRRARRTAGHRPHIPAALAGSPRAMTRMVEDGRKAKGRMVKLYVGIGESGSVTAQQRENYGLAICEAIMSLERQGARVEVIGHFHGNNVGVHVVLKRHDQRMDPSALAYGLAHSAVGRRLCFRALEELSGRPPAEFYNYGSPSSCLPLQKKLVNNPDASFLGEIGGGEPGDYSGEVVAERDIDTIDDARDYVRKVMTRALGDIDIIGDGTRAGDIASDYGAEW